MYSISRAIICFSLLFLVGCFPVRPGPDGNSIHIDYEKVQYSIACEFIRAWKMEYAYHDQPLEDAAFWNLDITINHTRTGTSGLKSTGSRTETVSNWTKVFDVGINPSSTGDYKLTASFKLKAPFSFFTNESLEAVRANRGDFVFADKFATECADPYLNLKQMAIYSQFENFIKGFKPETTRGLKYTNLNFEDTGQLILSTGGTFTYALVPYKVVLPPTLSYTDKLYIQAFATRKRVPTPKEAREAKLKEKRGQKVYVTNLNQVPRGGGSSRLSADEIRFLACRINYPGSGDVEKYNDCISHVKGKQFTIADKRDTGGSGDDTGFRETGVPFGEPPEDSSFESLLNTPKGFIADPDRERKRQLFEDRVEEALEDLE